MTRAEKAVRFIRRDPGAFQEAMNAVMAELSNEVDGALDSCKTSEEVLYNGFMRKGLLSLRGRLASLIQEAREQNDQAEEKL